MRLEYYTLGTLECSKRGEGGGGGCLLGKLVQLSKLVSKQDPWLKNWMSGILVR